MIIIIPANILGLLHSVTEGGGGGMDGQIPASTIYNLNSYRGKESKREKKHQGKQKKTTYICRYVWKRCG